MPVIQRFKNIFTARFFRLIKVINIIGIYMLNTKIRII